MSGGVTLCEAGLMQLEVVEAPEDIACLWACKNSADGGKSKAGARAQADLLIGASPDGIVRYGNGTLEVVEVKNHAPFRTARPRKGSKSPPPSRGRTAASSSSSTSPTYELFDNGPMDSIGCWHVPQLQLEMLCAGPACQSAIFASCSGTKGAHLFRMERDDAYLTHMLRLLRYFHDTYVSTGLAPPPDFLAVDPPPSELDYAAFLQRTLDLADKAPLWCAVPEDYVQRASRGSLPFEGPRHGNGNRHRRRSSGSSGGNGSRRSGSSGSETSS